MTYTVEGTFTVNISLEVEASTPLEAIRLAKEELNDYHRLDVHGSGFNPEKDVSFKLSAFED